jgi:hypothetical protein
MPWLFCIAGTLFCVAGVYYFYKHLFEETHSMNWSFIIMGMGVVLIGIGTAKYFHLIV